MVAVILSELADPCLPTMEPLNSLSLDDTISTVAYNKVLLYGGTEKLA